MRKLLNSFIDEQNGATAIEYALIASLVSITIIAALMLLSGSVTEMYGTLVSTINEAING